MISAIKVLWIYENIINATLKSSIPHGMFIKRVNLEFQRALLKEKIEGRVVDEPLDHGCSFVLTPIDDVLAYETKLPFLSQLSVYQDGDLLMCGVYSYTNGKSLYVFTSNNEINVKTGQSFGRLTRSYNDAAKVIEVDSIRNTDILEYLTHLHENKCKRVICYDSVGVMMFKLVIGDIDKFYAHRNADIPLREISKFIELTDVNVNCVNSVYEYSYERGDRV